jgi:VCBS repeat-containing protein
MTTRSKFRAGTLTYFEDVNFETVMPLSPLMFGDDFIGAGHTAGIPAAGSPAAGYPWVKKIVGAAPPTVALISNSGGGQVQAALTATSEKQDAALYWNDSLAIDVTKGAVWEARANLAVLPSAAGVQMVIGLAAAWIDGPDNNVKYLEFGCTANGSLLVRSQDGTTQSSIAAAIAGVAVVMDTTLFHTMRIDCQDVTDIGFYYDGQRVNGNKTVAFAATGANAILQPYAAVYKPSGTGVATLSIDKIDVWANR